MKHNQNLRTLAAFLAVLTAAGTVSCGSSADPTDTTISGGDSTEVVVTEEAYEYPDVDYDGYEFKVLNFTDYYREPLKFRFQY